MVHTQFVLAWALFTLEQSVLRVGMTVFESHLLFSHANLLKYFEESVTWICVISCIFAAGQGDCCQLLFESILWGKNGYELSLDRTTRKKLEDLILYSMICKIFIPWFYS